MTFDAIASGQSLFVDANVLLYYFTAHPRYGTACRTNVARNDRTVRSLKGLESEEVEFGRRPSPETARRDLQPSG